jgi:hypothetical protein
MKAEMRKLVIVGVATLVSGVIIACGGNGATNNDQGVSVTFLGLYANLPNNNAGGNNNTTGTNLQGCTRFPNQAAQPTPIPLGDDDGYYAIAGVQNNLFGQFFRTNQIIVDYFIAGAAIQPPSYTAGISIFTGPAENSQNNLNNNNNNTTNNNEDGGLRQPQNTSLPPSFNGACNTAFSRVPILPPQIQDWLVFNQAMLPAAPYTIDVTARLVGQSSAGDVFETNSLYIGVDIVPAGSTSSSASSTGDEMIPDEDGVEDVIDGGEESFETEEPLTEPESVE